MEPQVTNDKPLQDTSEQPMSAAGTVEAKETTGAETPKGDVSEYRTFAILGYILPFLFFLPLLDEKTKHVPYVRFHANQQLILLVLGLGVYVVLQGLLMGVLFMLGYYIIQLLNLALLVLMVIGVMHAYKGEMKELPFVGQFKLLK